MKELFEGEGLSGIGYHLLPQELDLQMHENNVKKTAFIAKANKFL